MRQTFSILPIASALLIFASFGQNAFAAGDAPTVPGTYKDWRGEIDHLTVVQSFKSTDYKRIIVSPLDTKDVDLPDETESTYQPVRETLAKSTDYFAEGIDRKVSGRFVIDRSRKGTTSNGTLMITARIAKMDPGSRSGRAFGKSKLFHAATDASETRITGEIIDAASGRVLLRFTQRHRAGLGLFGGGYEELLARTIRDIGDDVGSIIIAF